MEDEVLYGGARGGGKTDAGIMWLLYPVMDWLNAIRAKDFEKAKRLGRYRALVIRRNADDLKDWTDRAIYLYKQAFGNLVDAVGKPVEIKFGQDGPIIRTGHLKDENAYQKYRGHEYQRMVVEELTQIPDVDSYEDLISACRSTIEGVKPQIFATTNPDGPGFFWVKDRFKIPDWPNGRVETEVEVKMPNGDIRHRHIVFIPALLKDNLELMSKNPEYEVSLAARNDEARKKAWLEGFWGKPIIEGVIFDDEIKAMYESTPPRVTEVPHNPNYPVYTYWDIGRDATPILFLQLIGSAWHMIDFYEASGKGFDHYAEIIRNKPYWYGQHFGPHDLAKTDMSNETILRIAERYGIQFTIIPKAATADGIEAAKNKFPRLSVDGTKCSEYLKRISSFRREFDEDKQVYKDVYRHDWASHAGTATFYWGLAPDPIMPGQLDQEFNLYSQQQYS